MANKELNPKQIMELKDCFDLFDSDKSGTISIKELRQLFNKLDLRVNQTDLYKIMRLMDAEVIYLKLFLKDGSGSVDFGEFSSVMHGHFFKEFNQKEVEAAFDYFDRDKSGYISEEELFSAMSRFRNTITKNEIQRLMNFVDKDNDGRINKKEFMKLINNY